MALVVAFRKANPEAAAMRRWEITFVVSLALVCLAWGVGAWLVLPRQSALHQAMIYFYLMGISGGAVASYGAHAFATTVAVLSLMVPVTVAFALQDLAPLRAMAVGGLLYLAAAVRSMQAFYFFLRRTFQLQFELQQGYRYARAEADTDELTGLANRRAFMEAGRSALERARRYERPLSVILFDIDHFKQVNDRHGHAAGDEALRCVAVILRGTARASDTAGRLGGEEFAVLLPETARPEAVKLAERLRRDLAAIEFELDGTSIRFTCSFGVAQREAGTASIDELLKAADVALYEAKDGGRNRVVAAVQ